MTELPLLVAMFLVVVAFLYVMLALEGVIPFYGYHGLVVGLSVSLVLFALVLQIQLITMFALVMPILAIARFILRLILRIFF